MAKVSKITEEDLDFMIEMFNEEGKTNVEKYLRQEFNVTYVTFQRKIKEHTNYVFNYSTKKYEESKTKLNDYFLSMNELCQTNSLAEPKLKKDNIDPLLYELMKDRLNEIIKYIDLQQSSKVITINKKMMENNGYEVSIQ